MKRNVLLLLMFIFLINTLYGNSNNEENKENHFRYNYLWEIFVPGYNYYRKDEILWGNFFLFVRLLSLYSAFYYHRRFTSYDSLYKASQLADYYYGLGYSYYDPIDGGYKNTKQFYIESGRAIIYRNLSIGIHLIFLGIGLYKGYKENIEDYIHSSPIVHKQPLFYKIEISLNQKSIQYNNFYQRSDLIFSLTIPQDF